MNGPMRTSELRILKDFYPLRGGPWVAKRLGRSLNTVHVWAHKFGMRVTEECNSQVKSLGQKRRWATTDAQDLARFEARFIPVTETGCWIWTGPCCNGHPIFQSHRQFTRARIWALARYRRIFLDARQQTRARCGERLCMNPWHAAILQQEGLK